jgi:hypothetical protein
MDTTTQAHPASPLAGGIEAAARALEAQVIAWRRDFHANPELGNRAVASLQGQLLAGTPSPQNWAARKRVLGTGSLRRMAAAQHFAMLGPARRIAYALMGRHVRALGRLAGPRSVRPEVFSHARAQPRSASRGR